MSNMKEISIFSDTLAYIRENKTDNEKITSVFKFLKSLETSTNKCYNLNEFSKIELSTKNLSDNLVKQVIKIDKLIDALLEIELSLKNEIIWKTSSNFKCVPFCGNCCAYSYYLPSELAKLDDKIRSKLFKEREGMWKISQIDNKSRCTFFSLENDKIENQYGCQIHNYRPIRCKIYPFFPIVNNNQILIYLEDQIRMKEEPSDFDNSNDEDYSCPGLLESIDCKLYIEKTVKEYIEMCLELPLLAKTLVVNPKYVIRDNY